MYNAGNSWVNCNFPQDDESNCSFYDDSDNNVNCNYYSGNEKQKSQSQYSNISNGVSPTQIYRNISPTNEEQQCVNFNNQFYPQNQTTISNTNFNYGGCGIPVQNINNNNNNIPTHHHPYQRAAAASAGGVVGVSEHCVQYQRPNTNLYSPYNSSSHSPAAAPPQQSPLQPSFSSNINNVYPQGCPRLITAVPPAAQQHSYNPSMPNSIVPSAPCQGSQPWTYAYCYGYGYNNQEPCQFTQFVDIEDFMNNEKRKEKSRDAARCRRSRETEIFTELAQILPMKKEDVNQLDKASVMRVAIAYLKIREMLEMFPKIKELTGDFKIDTDNISDDDDTTQTSIASSPVKASSSSPSPSALDNKESFDLLKCAEASQFIKQTLDGFLIILSNDGDVSYVSDNITEYLGIAKIDILGQQIWEYSHQCDHAELKEALNIKRNGLAEKIKDENMLEEGISTDHRDLFVRFKCTLTSRGRSINIKSASYKVIHITGHLVVNAKGDRVLVAIGRPIPHPSNIEIPLGTTTFLTKHSLDMKFTYVDDKMLNLLGYKSEDLKDESVFGCHHGADSDELMTAFKTVLSKGQGETCRYRFLGKYGGYCWIVTQATIVYDKLKPQSVVCVNYVISNLEKNDEIYSLAQYEASQTKIEDCNNNNNSNEEKQNIENKQKLIEQQQQQIQQKQYQEEEKVDEILSITSAKPQIEVSISKSSSASVIQATITELEPASPPSPPPTTTTTKTTELSKINTDDDVADIDVDDNNITNSIDFIKREPSPPLQIHQTTTTTSIPSIVVPTNIVHNNNNSNKLIDNKLLIVRENSLSPLRRSLQSNCLIANITTKLIEENRPKSVTASVFRAAPSANPTTTTSPITTDLLPTSLINNNASTGTTFLNSYQLNVAPRAQSVTASVFTPISQLSNKQQQYIVKSTAAAVAATAAVLSQQQPQQQQQDMNKAFLAFEEDAAELTMLKEEPDELVHLTPAAVDAAGMPLDETTSLFGEMLGFMGTFGSLLPDDINSLDSSTPSTTETDTTATAAATRIQNCNNNNANIASNNNGNNKSSNMINTAPANAISNNNNSKVSAAAAVCGGGSGAGGGGGGGHIDPFINYRDESNDTNCSQHLLSPSVASESPEASSLPSLCSPNSLSQEDEFAFMTMSVDDDIDMTMRAPYIPMNEQDDLPLLTADDLMWCGSNAFSAEDLNIHKTDADVMQQLQQLQQHGDGIHRNHNLMNSYQEQQQHQQQPRLNQQHFSNSLCSSPASTVSSLSPSPLQQQQPQDTVFATDSSELAALLCGTGNGHLTILGNNNENDGGSQHNNNNNQHHHQQHHQQQQQQQHNQHQQQSVCSPIGGGNGGDLQRLQQFQQQLLGLNIDCKKEKFDNSNLCDSIEDAFENVYSKSSPNLDCWNDLLQINVNDTTSSSASCSPAAAVAATLQQQDCKQHVQLQQQQQQQNIILNAVPLITIQSTKNIMAQQAPQQQPNNKMIINDELLSTTNNNRNNSSSNKIAAIKLVNNVTPVTTTATIRVVENGKQLQQQQHQQQRAQSATKTNVQQHHPQQQHQQQQQQQHNSGNKRHLSSSSLPATQQTETKRLKSTNTIELQATPQLLQQLMATTNIKEQQQKTQRKTLTAAAQRWSSSSSSGGGSGVDIKTTTGPAANAAHQQHQQQSNSVLKNLLVSGCDDAIAIPIKGGLINDDNSMDQAPLPCCIPASLARPLHCQISTTSVLRNYRHNPMIGGPGVLPSPPFGSPNEDSNPPGLTSCDTGSESDSGIDDISMTDTDLPLKFVPNIANSYAMKQQQQNIDNDTKNILLMKYMKVAPLAAASIAKTAVVEPQQATIGSNVVESGTPDPTLKRKRSIIGSDNSKFVDTINNPLLTPFLMDLCNDDYNMNAEPFLEQNDIENVLSEWTNEMV